MVNLGQSLRNWGRNALFGLPLLVGLLVASCASGGPPLAEYDPQQRPDEFALTDPVGVRISPLDTVSVDVFGLTDFDGTYPVDPSGNIKFPLLGDVRAGGLTPNELSAALEDALGARYLQNPSVSVQLTQSAAQRFTVDGAVKKPGLYAMQGNLSLLQSVALAGGPAEGANTKRVVVFRQVDGRRAAASFNLNEIRKGEMEDPPVYANDIIVMDGTVLSESRRNLLSVVPILGIFRFF